MRRAWRCRCDLTIQERLVFLEDTDAHVMEQVNDTDVYICYIADPATKIITVERIRTLTGDDAPAGGKVFP